MKWPNQSVEFNGKTLARFPISSPPFGSQYARNLSMKVRPISTNCLFHYTKSLETLHGILTSGFQFSLVSEALPRIGWGSSPLTALGLQRTYTENHVVCFCDIPLTLAAGHRGHYSSYAVGLTKEWAMANGVAPVRYVHSGSPGFSGELMEFLEAHTNRLELGDRFVRALIEHKNGTVLDTESFSADAKVTISILEQLLSKALDFIADGAPYFKTYEGDDPLHKTPLKRYYDEREWRAVPLNNAMQHLRFTWNDVAYILCSTRQECRQLQKESEEICRYLGLQDSTLLWEKLRSFEEIDADY